MVRSRRYVAIRGSGYVALPGAKFIGPADPQEIIAVTLVVRPRRKGPELHADETLAGLLPPQHHYHSRQEFAVRQGAQPDELAQVEQFARKHGFEIVETPAPRHSVVLQGRCGDF